jgi:hypothetical protein
MLWVRKSAAPMSVSPLPLPRWPRLTTVVEPAVMEESRHPQAVVGLRLSDPEGYS